MNAEITFGMETSTIWRMLVFVCVFVHVVPSGAALLSGNQPFFVLQNQDHGEANKESRSPSSDNNRGNTDNAANKWQTTTANTRLASSIDEQNAARQSGSDIQGGLIATIAAGIVVFIAVTTSTLVAAIWVCRHRPENETSRETAHIQSHFSTSLTHPEKAGLHGANIGLSMVLTESHLLSVLDPITGDKSKNKSCTIDSVATSNDGPVTCSTCSICSTAQKCTHSDERPQCQSSSGVPSSSVILGNLGNNQGGRRVFPVSETLLDLGFDNDCYLVPNDRLALV